MSTPPVILMLSGSLRAGIGLELRAAIERAAGVLICTPEYAGTLPGSFKNLLDWTVGGTEISDKPVAWVNTSITTCSDGGAFKSGVKAFALACAND